MKRRLADPTAVDRVPFVQRRFVDEIGSLPSATRTLDLRASLGSGLRLTGELAAELFQSQLESRHLDYCSRELKKTGESFYTISSAGHEGNAAVAAAMRVNDPALLHYRSGAFFLQRARMAGYEHGARDVLLGATAAAEEPIAGGRHKVFGSKALWIPPQTSTIASHLPKAVGMAFALERAKRLGLPLPLPTDAIVMCSFGDASANHSSAAGAINAACWASHQGAPTPVLFVCEDNGIGISVPTPTSWVGSAYGHRPELRYFPADGLDLVAAYQAACEAVEYVRTQRRPAFLHLRVVRLLGHAGSDVESLYRSLDAIEATEARDPLLASARLLVQIGARSGQDLLAASERMRERIAQLGVEASSRPKLTDAREVMQPLAPYDAAAIKSEATRGASHEQRGRFWGDKLPEAERPAPLATWLNRTLGDLMVEYPELILFGEDVAQKGGVYGVTRDLCRRGKRGRVFDTLLDEQTILGTAIGAGHLGLLPIPEIQYLAYLHNAEDQLRGEAASLQFFSRDQFRNPMVVRIASYAYQKGFGGHFHNDNSVAVLRDIPGLIIASPAHGRDAGAMLRTCVAAATSQGRVCVFLEPIALYPERDLHEKGDGLWASAYDPSPDHVAVGEGKLWRQGKHLLIVSWANGLHMSLRAAERLSRRGIECSVFDLRWLAPLPLPQLLHLANAMDRVLVVDETRRSGGVAEALISEMVEGGYGGRIARVAAADSFIPLGEAANRMLVQEADIEAAAQRLIEET